MAPLLGEWAGPGRRRQGWAVGTGAGGRRGEGGRISKEGARAVRACVHAFDCVSVCVRARLCVRACVRVRVLACVLACVRVSWAVCVFGGRFSRV